MQGENLKDPLSSWQRFSQSCSIWEASSCRIGHKGVLQPHFPESFITPWRLRRIIWSLADEDYVGAQLRGEGKGLSPPVLGSPAEGTYRAGTSKGSAGRLTGRRACCGGCGCYSRGRMLAQAATTSLSLSYCQKLLCTASPRQRGWSGCFQLN